MDAITLEPEQQAPKQKHFGPRTIFELRRDTCRWPLWGDTDQPDSEVSEYCGEWTGGEVYCQHHHKKIVDPNGKRIRLRAR